MKLMRTLMMALAAVVVAGTVASAAPSFHAAFDVADEVSPSPETSPSPELSPEVSPEVSPEPTDPPETEPTEAPSPSPSPSETSSPEGVDVEGDSAAPDFSACVGLTGLENAICRHEALLVLQPENPGLANALEHLVANLAKHAGEAEDGTIGETSPDGTEGTADASEEEGTGDGGTTTVDTAPCPGKSCEPHGRGNANGHVKH